MSTASPVEYETRIRALEKLNATLAAEIDRMRPVVEACEFAAQTGIVNSSSGMSLKKIYDAISAYEDAKETR